MSSCFLRAMKKTTFQVGAPLQEREVPLAKPENEAIYDHSFRRYVQKTDTY